MAIFLITKHIIVPIATALLNVYLLYDVTTLPAHSAILPVTIRLDGHKVYHDTLSNENVEKLMVHL